MPIALGIDLGTTYTVAAVIKDGRPHIVPSCEGHRLGPSVVTFLQDATILVGQLAKQQAAINARRTVFSIKRYMGSDHRITIEDRVYSPQQISSLILGKVKTDVERYLGQKVDQAVITVPAYFNDLQRQATKEAAAMAGLEVLRIINEPTAAALAYGVQQEDVHTVMVWDLGGGTFDVSLLELGHGIFEVRAVSGDSWLGGDDYDRRLVQYLSQEFSRQHKIGIASDDAMTWQMLREVAEKAKIDLSTSAETPVRFQIPHGSDTSQVEVNLTRERFQELTADLVERMVAPTHQALADAGLQPKDIDRVILVGGATRMPAVQSKAWELLGKEPYRHVDPDEVVAMGAAIQAGMLLGLVEKVVLLDVLPLSLGIETQGGLFTRVIHRNAPLPASAGQIFTTAIDDQTSVDVHVLQGEREMALYNVSLGKFVLEGIPPLPKGTPKIEVTFDVDVDGIVHVSAEDLLSEIKEEVKVVSGKTLSPKEIELLLRDATSKADEDRRKRESIEARIEGYNMVAAAEKVLEATAGPGSEAFVSQIEKAVRDLEEALSNDKPSTVKELSSTLFNLLKDSSETQTSRKDTGA